MATKIDTVSMLARLRRGPGAEPEVREADAALGRAHQGLVELDKKAREINARVCAAEAAAADELLAGRRGDMAELATMRAAEEKVRASIATAKHAVERAQANRAAAAEVAAQRHQRDFNQVYRAELIALLDAIDAARAINQRVLEREDVARTGLRIPTPSGFHFPGLYVGNAWEETRYDAWRPQVQAYLEASS